MGSQKVRHDWTTFTHSLTPSEKPCKQLYLKINTTSLKPFLLLFFISGVVPDSFVTPWTVACQALLTMGSTGKNTGVSCHFFLPDPGIQPMSPALAGDSLPLRQVGSPQVLPR